MTFLTEYDRCDSMWNSDDTMTEHFPPRTSKRAPIETRVRLRFADLEDFQVHQSQDLSLGGMFLKGPNPPPVGTRVDFEFVLTDATELIRGTGEVMWVRPEDQGPEQPAGMGIRFLKLSPGSRAIIFHAVDRWIQEGGEPFDVEKGPAETTHPATAPEPPTEPAEVAEEEAPPAEEPEPTAAQAPAAFEPLSELVARASDTPRPPASGAVLDPQALEPESRPAEPAARDEKDAGERSSTAAWTGGVAFAREASPGIRWGRLVVIAALASLLAAAVSFVWLRDHDPSPPSVETSQASAAPAASETAPASLGEEGDPGAPGDAADGAPVLETAPALAADPAPEPPPTEPVTRLREISWRRSNAGTEVILVGDGSFELQRWTRFRLSGANPREVVKIRGIEGPYERSFLPVGSPEVRQVRTGFHILPGSNELHVVVDLTDPGVEATAVETDGRTLRIRLARPRS